MVDTFKQVTVLPERGVFVQVIREETKKITTEVAYRIANKLAGRVRGAILGQKFAPTWPPLNPAYLRRKIRLDLDERMLIATGDYVNSIRARKLPDGTYEVAPSNRLTENGQPLNQIGSWLEFGTRDENGAQVVPPRPHWRPVWREFIKEEKQIRKGITEQLLPSVRKRIRLRRANRNVR